MGCQTLDSLLEHAGAIDSDGIEWVFFAIQFVFFKGPDNVFYESVSYFECGATSASYIQHLAIVGLVVYVSRNLRIKYEQMKNTKSETKQKGYVFLC